MTAVAARPPARQFVASPKQAAFLEAVFSNRYRFLAYGGAVGGGKTVGILLALTLLARVFPGSVWYIVRKDLPTLKRTTIPSYNRMRDAGLDGFLGRINQSDWTATHANGSRFVFFTESLAEDPDLDRWKGIECNGFAFEEANECAERSFHKAKERAGRWIIPATKAAPTPHQPPPLVLLTFNPAPNWVRHTFYDPHRAGTLAAPYYFLPATVEDNPHLPDEYLANLKELPAQEYARFVLGDWDAVSGRYFAELRADVHLIPRTDLPAVLPAWWAMWGGYDWGFRHNAVASAFVEDGDGNRTCLDTVFAHRLTDREQAERLRETFTAAGAERALSCVYSGGDVFNRAQAHGLALPISVADTFATLGIACVPAYTERVGGWRQLRQDLAVPPAVEDRPALLPRLRFVDTPGNRRLLDTLLALEPDPNRPEDVRKVDADDQGRGGDDAADALRYGIATRAFVQAPSAVAAHPWTLDHDPAPLLAELFAEGAARETGGGRDYDDLPNGF